MYDLNKICTLIINQKKSGYNRESLKIKSKQLNSFILIDCTLHPGDAF